MKSFNRIRKLNEIVGLVLLDYGINNAVVADIATDHGYLAELLSRNENISKIYATDISKKCLDKTDELIKNNNLIKIETKLGDGLEPINQVDLSVMAGIGGYEIIKILSNQNITNHNAKKCSLFVLQPTKNVVDLRKFLIKNDYEIVIDKIIKSGGKFYPIIVVDLNKKCSIDGSVFELYFGRSNSIENTEFVGYLEDLTNRFEFLNNEKLCDVNIGDLETKKDVYQLAKSLLKLVKGD